LVGVKWEEGAGKKHRTKLGKRVDRGIKETKITGEVLVFKVERISDKTTKNGEGKLLWGLGD